MKTLFKLVVALLLLAGAQDVAGQGVLSPRMLRQDGATTSQCLMWGGTVWAPGDCTTSSDAVLGKANLTTAGAVSFVTSSGTLTQDGVNFFWDNVLKRLGIGTATPSAALTIEGTGVNVQVKGAGSQGYKFYSSAGSGREFWLVTDGGSAYLKNITDGAGNFKIRNSSNADPFSVDYAAPNLSLYVHSDGKTYGTEFVGPVTGNASTATALAADPTDCSTGQRAVAIDASGTLTCLANPVVDAKADYGASGNGSDDDYAEIAAAITAAGTGGTVVIPAGTYKVNTGLVVSANNVTLRCYGATFLRGGNVTILEITGDGVTVEGCGFNGNNPTYTGSVLQVGTGADGTKLLRNNVYGGSAYGIYVYDSPNTLIDGNRVTANLDIGIFVEYDSENATVVNNYVDNTSCTAANCHNISLHSTNAGDAVDRSVVSGNTLINASNDGFCIEWGQFSGVLPSMATINNNVCMLAGTDAAGGISVTQGVGGSITGNVIDAASVALDSDTIAGIEATDMADCSITGNTIRMASAVGGSGITLNHSSGCVVSGNTINGSGTQANSAGVYVVASTSETSARNLIQGNTIYLRDGATAPGVFLQNLVDSSVNSYNTIQGNFITGTATASQPCVQLDNYIAGAMAGNAILSNQLDNCAYGVTYSAAATGRIIGNSIPRYVTKPLYIVNSYTTPLIDSMEPMLFADLGTFLDGSRVYCSDCAAASPCAGSGSGALAKRLNGAWECTDGGAGSGYATIQDETTPLTQRTTVNFTGAGVECADDAGNTRTNCTISGGGAVASRDLTDLEVSVGSGTQLDFAAGALGDHDESFTLAAGYWTIQSRSVSDITESTTTTITTSAALGTGFHTGDSVHIVGVTGGGLCDNLNALLVITVTGASTFTVPVDTTAATCAGGTVAGTGSGTAYVYGRDDGEIVLEVPASSGVIATCDSGSCVVNQVTTPAFDLGIAPLATVTLASGAWGTATDVRAFLGKRLLTAGTGISVSGDSVSIDTATVPQLGGTNSWTGTNDLSGASRTASFKAGTTAPATCTVGDTFFDTDASAGSNFFGCTATDTWTAQGGGAASCTGYVPIQFATYNGSTAIPDVTLQTTGVTAGGYGLNDQKFSVLALEDGENLNFSVPLPPCYSGETITLRLYTYWGTNSGAGTVEIKSACIADSEVMDNPAFNHTPTTNDIALAADTSGDMTIDSGTVNITGCAANELLSIELQLVQGTIANFVRLAFATLTW